MQIPTEANQYISSLSRGGLWSPHSCVVSIAEVSELVFKKHTNENRVTCLPVDKIVSEVLTSPLVKSLWCNIIKNRHALAYMYLLRNDYTLYHQ